MTISELIDQLEKRLPHFTRKDAEIIVDTIFFTMLKALARGERIEIRGFGIFKVKHRGLDRRGIQRHRNRFRFLPGGYPL